ncbi:MAG: tRNA (uridine(34)/cytosine(34)/5-carboxymethylaminomethyluridine(34)-2'-O)-methyltransferase TrmL [Pseudomonadota bacterium]|nr:tRNA (uridine(34)/cytosine(34)/5-carboxymethylaminomethyluridine(34)-2'-O)-methyltransferase TrmL [Pseudomonadota bacterium]
MFHVVLYEPEIPPNTGNIMRLCANTGAALHLIQPLGFDLDDRRLRRAGLDYREWARVREHRSLADFFATVNPGRALTFSTRGSRAYHDLRYRKGDALIFGPETRGLPQVVIEDAGPAHTLRIPMVPNSRSLNLSNAVAIVVYEAWRQHGFSGNHETHADNTRIGDTN